MALLGGADPLFLSSPPRPSLHAAAAAAAALPGMRVAFPPDHLDFPP